LIKNVKLNDPINYEELVNCFKVTPILKTNPSEGSNEFRIKGIRKNNSSLSSSPLPCSPSK